VLAGYIIIKFLGFQNSIKIRQFQTNLQTAVNNIWKSPQGTNDFTYNLPNKIERICIFDVLSNAKGKYDELYPEFELISQNEKNIFFYPIGSSEGIDGFLLEHINLKNITLKENPFCIENSDGKIQIKLKMNYGENLVQINK
jgi:hypothetical protein